MAVGKGQLNQTNTVERINQTPDFGGKIGLGSFQRQISDAKQIGNISVGLSNAAFDSIKKRQKQDDSLNSLKHIEAVATQLDMMYEEEANKISDISLSERVRERAEITLSKYGEETAMTPGARSLYDIGAFKASALINAQALNLEQSAAQIRRSQDFIATIDSAAVRAHKFAENGGLQPALDIYDNIKRTLDSTEFSPKTRAKLEDKLNTIALGSARGLLLANPQELLDRLDDHTFDNKLKEHQIFTLQKAAIAELAKKEEGASQRQTAMARGQVAKALAGQDPSTFDPVYDPGSFKEQYHNIHLKEAALLHGKIETIGTIPHYELEEMLSKYVQSVGESDDVVAGIREQLVRDYQNAVNVFNSSLEKDAVETIAVYDPGFWKSLTEQYPIESKEFRQALLRKQMTLGVQRQQRRQLSQEQVEAISDRVAIAIKGVNPSEYLGVNSTQMAIQGMKELYKVYKEDTVAILMEAGRYTENHNFNSSTFIAFEYLNNPRAIDALIKSSMTTEDQLKDRLPGLPTQYNDLQVLIKNDPDFRDKVNSYRGAVNQQQHQEAYTRVAAYIGIAMKTKDTKEILDRTKDLLLRDRGIRFEVLGGDGGTFFADFNKKEGISLNANIRNYDFYESNGVWLPTEELAYEAITRAYPSPSSNDPNKFYMVVDTPNGPKALVDNKLKPVEFTKKDLIGNYRPPGTASEAILRQFIRTDGALGVFGDAMGFLNFNVENAVRWMTSGHYMQTEKEVADFLIKTGKEGADFTLSQLKDSLGDVKDYTLAGSGHLTKGTIGLLEFTRRKAIQFRDMKIGVTPQEGLGRKTPKETKKAHEKAFPETPSPDKIDFNIHKNDFERTIDVFEELAVVLNNIGAKTSSSYIKGKAKDFSQLNEAVQAIDLKKTMAITYEKAATIKEFTSKINTSIKNHSKLPQPSKETMKNDVKRLQNEMQIKNHMADKNNVITEIQTQIELIENKIQANIQALKAYRESFPGETLPEVEKEAEALVRKQNKLQKKLLEMGGPFVIKGGKFDSSGPDFDNWNQAKKRYQYDKLDMKEQGMRSDPNLLYNEKEIATKRRDSTGKIILREAK